MTVGIVVTGGSRYVPPTEALQRKVRDSFMRARSESDQPLRFMIEVESGSTERHQIAIDLETMVGNRAVVAYPRGDTNIGRFPVRPMTVILHPSNVATIQRFIEELEPYIESQWGLLSNSNFPLDMVKIYVGGTPNFEAGGRVRIA